MTTISSLRGIPTEMASVYMGEILGDLMDRVAWVITARPLCVLFFIEVLLAPVTRTNGHIGVERCTEIKASMQVTSRRKAPVMS